MNTSATTPIKTAIIWARTSSSGSLETRQSTTRQVEDLQDFASRNHYQVEKTFEEHISGRTAFEHRAILSSAINYAKENLNIFQEDGKPNPFLNIFISCLQFSASAELEAIEMIVCAGR